HHVNDRMKLRGNMEKLRRVIKNRLDERSEFKIADLIPYVTSTFGLTEAEAFDMLLQLADFGGIKPISIHTVLQRQGLGLANGENVDVVLALPESEPEPVVDEAVVEHEPEPEPQAEPEPEPEPVTEEPPKFKVKRVEADEDLTEADKKGEISEEDKFLADVEELLRKEKEEKDKKES
ncbi:MAG: hypothetical protein ACFFAY_11300, partial [Promethearchaeota archaeon]